MAYVYPLSLDILNLTGKHDDVCVESMASKKQRASKLLLQNPLLLSPMQIRMLVLSCDFCIESLRDMLASAPTDVHKRCIESSVSCYLDIRDILEKYLDEVKYGKS